MTDSDIIQPGTEFDTVEIVVNSLYLSLGFLLERVEKAGGKTAAQEARHALIEGIKSGNIDMAIMEDRKLFDFVVSVVEALPEPEPA